MDLIERELATEWIYNWRDKNKYYHPLSKNKTIPISEVIDILEGVPSAEKTGEWIDTIEHDGWSCSNCGCSITKRYGKYSYCPYCGAIMQGD